MHLFTKVPVLENPSVVALGYFDGLHRGHQKVLGKMREIANQQGLVPVVFSFSMQAQRPTRKQDAAWLLTEEEKQKGFAALGAEICVSPDFSLLRDMTAKAFVQNILCAHLKARQIVCGEDHRFGKDALGDVAYLTELGKASQAAIVTVPPVYYDDTPVHSSTIRALLLQGDVAQAGHLLGYDYAIKTTVQEGNHLGNRIGTPTINQPFAPGALVPKFGVYASYVVWDGRCYPSITNIGVKPTVQTQGAPIAETHIIDFKQNLYQKEVCVRLRSFLRAENKFCSIEALKAQIACDVAQVKEMLQDD